MSQTKVGARTPGPWRVDVDCGTTGLPAIYDEHGRKLALVTSEAGYHDAEAMALSPDLLDACRGALPFVASIAQSYRLDQAEAAEVWNRLRAVLAKAEGGAS